MAMTGHRKTSLSSAGAVCLCGLIILLGAAAVHATVPGVRLSMQVVEMLAAAPPLQAVVDTQVVDVRYDLETTLAVGPVTFYLIASSAGADATRIAYTLYPYGPSSGVRNDDVTVAYGVPLIIDNINGKGKSSYRILITPEPVQLPEATGPAPSDTSVWRHTAATYYFHNAIPFSLADFHFSQLQTIIDAEFSAMRDTFNLTVPGRINAFFTEIESAEFPVDPRYGFGVDPARNRVTGIYGKDTSRIDTQAFLLESLYRWWGYAPDLLAIGASCYVQFFDYDVLADRAAGRAVPLDSLARTLDFKRHDPDVARHHAASFVHWLIATEGMSRFRELYQRATDLSLARALWAGYGRTLAEFEHAWLAYLDRLTFSSDTYYRFAARARRFKRVGRYLEMLDHAVHTSDSLHPQLWLDYAIAQGHFGLWQEAAVTLRELIADRPDFLRGYLLLAEAWWSLGDDVQAALVLNAAREKDPSVGQIYLKLGDIEFDRNRVDSAAVLWGSGLDNLSGSLTRAELFLRLGRYERRHGREDKARQYFVTGLRFADEVSHESGADPAVWTLIGAHYLELDSTARAFEYLNAALYLADAPVDRARIHRLLGSCHDLEGDRDAALREYDQVFAGRVPYMEQVLTRQLINRPYGHGRKR